MNKKLVIFDLDGTLLNTIDDLAVSANYALRQHGYPEHELPAYRYFVGNGITKLIERALPEAERCEPTILQLREEFVGYYQRHKTDLTRPYPGIPELLSHLSAKGIQLAVASNKYHQGTVELIRHYFGTDLFRLYWDNAGTYLQTRSAIVYEILHLTGITPADALYIGDSGVDMQTARRSGITSIGVSWGFRPRQELTENGACHIVDRPEEIIRYL
ncbi:MAG: HAD family hydrolase [Odoribacter splanchnicus]